MPEPPKFLPAVVATPLRDGTKRRGRSTNNISRSPEWPPWVEEALFVRWIEEDQHMPRALARLEADWEDFAELEYDPETGDVTPVTYREVPFQTAHGWKRRHNWDLRMAEETARRFPELNFIHNARLVIARDIALRRVLDVLQDPTAKYADLGVFAKLALEHGGSGTAGSKDRLAPQVRAQVNRAIDLASMNEEQLAELQKQIIREDKAQLPERRG
jgi:hypothetical protein